VKASTPSIRIKQFELKIHAAIRSNKRKNNAVRSRQMIEGGAAWMI
jgi:hypothetical protein